MIPERWTPVSPASTLAWYVSHTCESTSASFCNRADSFFVIPRSARVGMFVGGSFLAPPTILAGFPDLFPAIRTPGFFGISLRITPSLRRASSSSSRRSSDSRSFGGNLGCRDRPSPDGAASRPAHDGDLRRQDVHVEARRGVLDREDAAAFRRNAEGSGREPAFQNLTRNLTLGHAGPWRFQMGPFETGRRGGRSTRSRHSARLASRSP